MTVWAVSIVKSTQFHGGVSEFGNTYHFTDAVGAFDPETAVNDVAELERAVTDSDISFVRGVVWGPTDGPQIDNIIVGEYPLDGTGVIAPIANMFQECCVLVTWGLPRSPITNRKRYLHKYLRVGSLINGSNSATQGMASIPQGDRDQYLSEYAQPVSRLGLNNDYILCTEDGAENDGNPVINPYVRTRQIGR